MKINIMITNLIARGIALAAVFALVTAPVAPAFAQSYDDWDYGYDYGGDYGYYDDYTYDDWDYGYDYGGDYGYYDDYEYSEWDYGYDYGGDYGYYDDYSYNDYDYGDYSDYGGDYGYYDDYTYDDYDYGDYGGDYGYYDDYTYDDYDYGDYGGDYGYYDDYDYGDYGDYAYDYGDYDYDYGDYEYDYGDYDYDYDGYDWDYGDDWGDWGDWEEPYYPPYTSCVDDCYEPPCQFGCDAPRPVCTLDATPTSIEEGEDFRLEWTTRNATNVSITTLGSVDLDGSAVLSPRDSMTYTLTASGPGGYVTCTERVIVEEDIDTDNDNVRCDAFTASDTNVERGDSITLRWNTTDADSVRIDQGIGSVADDGSERVRVDRDTTYTLIARNGSDEDSCRVTVRVDDEDDEDDEDAPRCRLTISDTEITPGQSVTVSWDNLRTDRAILRDNHGNTIADSRDRNSINEDRDSRVFRPTTSTDYTLTVYNGNTTRTCTVGTDITSGVTLNSTRGQDGIRLSQVPYTGFEAGPVLTFAFYGALGLWGIAVAYALVMKKAAIATVAAAAAHAPIAPVALAATAATVSPEIEEEEGEEEETPLSTDDASLALSTLEARAHAQHALISSEALAYLVAEYGPEAEETLDRVIERGEAQFPKEGGWIILNKEKILSILS